MPAAVAGKKSGRNTNTSYSCAGRDSPNSLIKQGTVCACYKNKFYVKNKQWHIIFIYNNNQLNSRKNATGNNKKYVVIMPFDILYHPVVQKFTSIGHVYFPEDWGRYFYCIIFSKARQKN